MVEKTVHPAPAHTDARTIDPVLSKVNWEALEKMRDFIRDKVQPESLAMNSYYSDQELDRNLIADHGYQEVPCGTVGCVLGHVALNRELNPGLLEPFDIEEGVLTIPVGLQVLGFYMFHSDWDCLVNVSEHSDAVFRMTHALEDLRYRSLKEVQDFCHRKMGEVYKAYNTARSVKKHFNRSIG